MNDLYIFDIIQKALKVSILFTEASLTKIDKECKSSMKVCYKKSEQTYILLHSVFGNLQIFLINAEGVGSEKKVLREWGEIKRF